jgi:hypothetical protein
MVHVGLDLHTKRTEVAVIDDRGEVVDRREFDNNDNREAMSEYFGAIGDEGIATVEATRSWYWFVEFLEEQGLAVNMTHPLKVRLIAEATVKTDKICAATLAQLERTGFLPKAYMPPRDIRDSRELLRYRMALGSGRRCGPGTAGRHLFLPPDRGPDRDCARVDSRPLGVSLLHTPVIGVERSSVKQGRRAPP